MLVLMHFFSSVEANKFGLPLVGHRLRIANLASTPSDRK
jgi:hypothetical protein